MYEILFEDGSRCPYTLHIIPETFERPLSMSETASLARRLIVYTRGFVEVAAMPAYFREVEKLPCLQPWNGKLQEAQSIEDNLRRQVESLTRGNDSLSEQLRVLKDASRDMERERQTTAALRQGADRLRNESSAKDARIKALEGEVSAITGNIERQVSEKVEKVRKTSEENELNALVAEDNCAEALRRADKAERICKRLKLLLRKNKIDPTMAFADGDSAFNGAV
jgi:myosin heavy subunit